MVPFRNSPRRLRYFLLDLGALNGSRQPRILASACRTLERERTARGLKFLAEGVADTPAVVLISSRRAPGSITLDGKPLTTFTYSEADDLCWIRFRNESRPQEVVVE